MITSRNYLHFYFQADMMMNRGHFKEPPKKKLLHLVALDYIMEFLKAMRKVQYYSLINRLRFFRLFCKLGFCIGYDVCDYGLGIPHYGTIVVRNTNRIGLCVVLHTSIYITDTGRRIGKGLSLSTGAKITGGEMLGDHIVVAANSVVTKSFPESNALLVGMPAVKKTGWADWYSSLKDEMKRRVYEIEKLKTKLQFE